MPQCVMCMKSSSNASIKPSLLQRHLQTNHPDKKDRDPNYFKRLGENAKKQRLNKTGKQYQQSMGIVTASYEVSLLVARNKKPHTIAEELVMPAAKVLAKHVIGDKAVSKLNSVSVSNNTIVTIIISGLFMLLSRVDVVFCFVRYFRYFPVYKPSLVYFILQVILLVVISCTPPADKTFLICFICVFMGCSLGSSFRYSLVFKSFLVNF